MCGETIAFSAPVAGRKTQLFHLLFAQPGKVTLVQLCIHLCMFHGQFNLLAAALAEAALEIAFQWWWWWGYFQLKALKNVYLISTSFGIWC